MKLFKLIAIFAICLNINVQAQTIRYTRITSEQLESFLTPHFTEGLRPNISFKIVELKFDYATGLYGGRDVFNFSFQLTLSQDESSKSFNFFNEKIYVSRSGSLSLLLNPDYSVTKNGELISQDQQIAIHTFYDTKNRGGHPYSVLDYQQVLPQTNTGIKPPQRKTIACCDDN